MKGKLGRSQIECLKTFAEARKFEPSRNRQPWPVMKTLAVRGLIWCEQRTSTFWNAGTGRWDFTQTYWWAGLTTDGQIALAATDRTTEPASAKGDAE